MKKKKHKENSVKVEKQAKHVCKNSCWMIASIALAVLLIAMLVLGLTGVILAGGKDVMSQSKAEAKANEYVSLLSSPEAPLNIEGVEEENGLFRIDLTVQGQPLTWYMSGDGELFMPDVFSLQDIENIVNQQNLQEQQAQQPPAQGDVSVSLEGANTLGSADSDVVLVEYSSATCPFCARYHQDTFPSIKSDYVDEGDVIYVYKHYVRNEVDILAANAMECAGEQNSFFEYNSLVYQNQNLLGQQASYTQWAEQLGLDVAEFESCFSSMKYTDKANAETAEGQGNGITGTPGFLVNSRLISGAQPLSSFQSAINAELAN